LFFHTCFGDRLSSHPLLNFHVGYVSLLGLRIKRLFKSPANHNGTDVRITQVRYSRIPPGQSAHAVYCFFFVFVKFLEKGQITHRKKTEHTARLLLAVTHHEPLVNKRRLRPSHHHLFPWGQALSSGYVHNQMFVRDHNLQTTCRICF